MSSIVTLCLSAGIQKTISFDSLKTGEVNRSRSYIYDAAGKAVNSARVLVQLMEADNADRRREDSRAFENAADNKAVSAFRAPEDSRASQAAAADKASGAYKACAPESACQAAPDNKASSAFKAPAAPDDVTLICPLGKKNADFFLQLAARDGLNPETVLIPGYTRECCTLLDDATGEVTELVVEEPAPEGDAPVSDLLFTLRTALARASAFNRLDDSGALPRTALLFAGSRPAFWPQDVIQQIALAAKKAGALFMADFRGNDLLSLLDASATPALTPDIIKINEAEFRETFMRAPCSEKAAASVATSFEKTAGYAAIPENADSLAAAICEKSRELGNIIVVTRGADSTLAADRGTLYECASEKVHAVNTIGCGDSFNAGFLYEYMTSGNVEMALKKGTWCAARNAGRLSPGTIR